jgi:hypothetical protein
MLASDDRRLVIEFKAVAQTYRVFLGNDRALREYLTRHIDPAVALPLWDLNNRPAFDAFLDEVVRLLHNYLASAGSLRDHTRRVWAKYLPDDPAYREHARATFAESGLSEFVQSLRNYSLHNQLPIAHGHMSIAGDEISWGVRLSRTDLVRWAGWRVGAKQYLRDLDDDGIDLGDLVAAYTSIVVQFNKWFGRSFVSRQLNALERLRKLEEEHATALADLDRSRSQLN